MCVCMYVCVRAVSQLAILYGEREIGERERRKKVVSIPACLMQGSTPCLVQEQVVSTLRYN